MKAHTASAPHAVAAPATAVIDVDLSPFSLGHERIWWIALVMIMSGPLALAILAMIGGWLHSNTLMILGGVAFVAWLVAAVVGFVLTVKARMSNSTTGTKRPCLRAQCAGARPPGFDRTLGEIVAAVEALRSPSPPPAPVPEAKRRAAKGYVALAFTLLVAGPAVLLLVGLFGGLTLVLVLFGVFALFTRARRVLQPGADEVLAQDHRPPVLFLRSFRDDRVKANERVTLPGGIPAVQKLRFEEALAARLRDFGPFLAVGEPGEGLPQLGAARAYLPENHWQEVVLGWIGSAQVIAMLCGPTHWIHWEMERTLERGRLDRLLLILPPGRRRRDDGERRTRWDNIVASLGDTAQAEVLRKVDIANVRIVQMLPDGRVMVYRSAHDLVQDYELAITIALYAAWVEGATRARPAAAAS